MDIASEAWRDISIATDNSTWSQGEFWNLTDSGWVQPYSQVHVSVYGDLYLAIDRIAIDLARFPLGTDFSRLNTTDVETQTSADRSTPQAVTMETSDWLNYGSLGGHKDTLNGAYLHVAQASSRKELNTPSTVQVSLYFLVVVVTFNVFKLTVLLTVLFRDRAEYLVTLGDAASSFLKRKDPHTTSQCLLSRETVLASLRRPLKERKYDEREAAELGYRLGSYWLPRSRSYFSPFHDRTLFIYTLL